jgi:hypothetical protein
MSSKKLYRLFLLVMGSKIIARSSLIWCVPDMWSERSWKASFMASQLISILCQFSVCFSRADSLNDLLSRSDQ